MTTRDMNRGVSRDMNDEQLASAYCDGNAAAFDQLYARHRLPLFAFLKRHSGRSQEEVEEVFQETWLKFIHAPQRFDATRPFAPWLFRIARNCMIDRWRHLSAVASLHVADHDALLGAGSDGRLQPEARMHAEELADRWEHALAALPTAQREALVLKLETGMNLEALAAALDAPREAVKSRLRYALKRMSAHFEEVFDDR